MIAALGAVVAVPFCEFVGMSLGEDVGLVLVALKPDGDVVGASVVVSFN